MGGAMVCVPHRRVRGVRAARLRIPTMRAPRKLHRTLLACGTLALATLAACRSRPAADTSFHAGEARRSEVRRQRISTLQPPTRTADALIVAPPGCHGSFGEAVAVNDTLVVVGAPQAELDGRVWVYDTTRLDAAPCMLQPPPGSSRERFGASVAVTPSGRWIAVGAPHADVDGQRHAGRVYLWRQDGDTWKLERAFSDPDADTANELLGSAVAVQDDCVIAGAPHASMKIVHTDLVPDRRRPAPPRPGQPEKPPPSGEPIEVQRVSQVFLREGAVLSWIREADGTWTPPAVSLLNLGRGSSAFGSVIALRGGQAVIGAPTQRTRYGDQGGTVSVFFRRGSAPWRREPAAVMSPVTAEAADLFGSSVASTSGLLVAGIPGANLKLEPDAGRVAVYRQNVESRIWSSEEWWQEGWERQPLLQSPQPETGSDFGRSVGVSGRRIIVGEPNASRGANSGRVFVFEKAEAGDESRRAAWQPTQEWLAPPVARMQRFGAAMDATEALVAISAPGSERVPGCVVIFRQDADEEPAEEVPGSEARPREEAATDAAAAASAGTTEQPAQQPVSPPPQPAPTSP